MIELLEERKRRGLFTPAIEIIGRDLFIDCINA